MGFFLKLVECGVERYTLIFNGHGAKLPSKPCGLLRELWRGAGSEVEGSMGKKGDSCNTFNNKDKLNK